MKRVGIVIALVLICAAGITLKARQSGTSSNGHLTIEKLIDIKHPSNPVWSYDGKHVAFLWDRAGVTDLYVVPADGSAKPIAITTGGGASNGFFWSGDSKSLYFNRGGQMMQISADGGSAQPAQLPGRLAVFSPDGSRLAYLNGNEIHLRAGDGKDTKIATAGTAVNTLTWTANGQHLTFAGGGGRGNPIYHDVTPAYSGAKLIFRSTENVQGPAPDNYIVAATGGNATKYSVGARGFGGGRGSAPNRWLDANHILSDRTSSDFKHRTISIVDIATGGAKIIQDDAKDKFWSVTGDAEAGSQASPDGKWISFLSDRDGWDHLYVMPANGAPGTATQISKGKFEAWRPAWSPDSTRIAFDSNEGTNPGSRHIGVVTINTDLSRSSIRMLTSGRGADVQPIWSPDGSKILFQHTDPQNSADLYVIDAKAPNAKPVRLTDSMPPSIDKSLLTEPQLVHYTGPDGKQIPAYLFVPKDLDRSKKHPAIVWIHGDGINQNYDGWHIQRNYAVYYSIHQ
jgi:Tol biopolymer transport system component